MNFTIYSMQKISITAVILLLLISISACKPKSERNSKTKETAIDSTEQFLDQVNLAKVNFYLENSESMFGYVNGSTEYIKVVSDLAGKNDFVKNNVSREFNLVNGSLPKMDITYLGEDPQVLAQTLNTNGFRKGDITKSDLNSMFQLALEKANNDTISILISDAIYDIQADPASAAGALAMKGKGTRESFIRRLSGGSDNVQTLMIKLSSNFNGKYFFVSKKGFSALDQQRPYYIWVFGEEDLLNQYFNENYITKLPGYVNYARFSEKINSQVEYSVLPSVNKLGTFKPNNNNKFLLENAVPDRKGKGFQFTIGVDFSSLPFSDHYLTSIENYICSNPNYSISSIVRNTQNIPGFQGTHLIAVFSDKNPVGNVEINLKNEVPNWIKETDTDDETSIDETHTYGFQFLTEGITDAYASIQPDKKLATFKIQIKK